MVTGVINADATVIPDQAEVWLLPKASAPTGITSFIPALPTSDLSALGWSFCGLIDDKKGIPMTPTIEVKDYNAFGYPQFRVKLRNGKLMTAFTALEINSCTRQFVLPGSTAAKKGPPKNVQFYVLYKWTDNDITNGTKIWVTLAACPIELKTMGGIVEGELSWAECNVHHTTDANRDIFQEVAIYSISKLFTIGTGVTGYVVTVDGVATGTIATTTSAALQTALQALPNVGVSGVTVSGSGGAPGTLTALFTVPVNVVSALGTGGTVGVS
jgi:hypothetical protein